MLMHPGKLAELVAHSISLSQHSAVKLIVSSSGINPRSIKVNVISTTFIAVPRVLDHRCPERVCRSPCTCRAIPEFRNIDACINHNITLPPHSVPLAPPLVVPLMPLVLAPPKFNFSLVPPDGATEARGVAVADPAFVDCPSCRARSSSAASVEFVWTCLLIASVQVC